MDDDDEINDRIGVLGAATAEQIGRLQAQADHLRAVSLVLLGGLREIATILRVHDVMTACDLEIARIRESDRDC